MEVLLSNYKTGINCVFFLLVNNTLVCSVCFRWQRHFQGVFPPAGQCHTGTPCQHGHPKHVCRQVRGHVHGEGEGTLDVCVCVCSCTLVDVGVSSVFNGSCGFQEKSLAVLAGDRCHCGFPTPLFSLHELENEDMCLHRCHGEEFESCGNEEYFVVYQTQVQGKVCPTTDI